MHSCCIIGGTCKYIQSGAGFGATVNFEKDTTIWVVLSNHIGSLVSMLEYHRERPEVSNAWVLKYVW